MPACEGLLPGAKAAEQPATTQPPKRLEDSELEARYRSWIGAIVQRDERSLAAFYEDTVARVHGLALRITRERATAEEVCVDVYWQVWREAHQYDPARGRVLTWLLTIARTRALDALRRRGEVAGSAEAEATLDKMASPDGDPQDLLLAMERGSAVHAALLRLTSVQRQLLALAFFRSYTHEEIAAHTRLPIGSVKTHIRRGLLALRRHLGAVATERDSQ